MWRYSAQDKQSLVSPEEQQAQHCLGHVDALHPHANTCAEGLRCSAALQLMQAQCVSKCKKRFISRRRDARVAPACSVVTNSATVATGGALMPSCSASAADEAADVEAGAGWGGDGGEVVAGAGGGAVSFCLLCAKASLATVVSMCQILVVKLMRSRAVGIDKRQNGSTSKFKFCVMFEDIYQGSSSFQPRKFVRLWRTLGGHHSPVL